MPLIHIKQPDEAITWRTIAFDEEGGFWAGVQKAGAIIALAGALAATANQAAVASAASAQWQDELPTTLAHEEYSQTKIVQSFPASVQPAVIDQNDFLGHTPEEDYQLQKVIWPQQTVQHPLFDTPEYVFQPDEDYDLQSVLWPQQTPQQQVFYQDEVVPQPVVFVPDEDYNLLMFSMPVPPVIMPIIDSSDLFVFIPPPPSTQNYVNTGTHNYISQEIGDGVKF